MGIAKLPVSGRAVRLGQPTGAGDLLLLEGRADPTRLTLDLLAHVAEPVDGDMLWEDQSATDIDAGLLLLRAELLGDRIRADAPCPDCGQRFDVEFSVSEYLDHHRPRTPRGVRETDEPGWFSLGDASERFRLPTGADLLAVAHMPKPHRALQDLCVRPSALPGKVVRRLVSAMEALAPSLNDDLRGTCPECGNSVAMTFDAQRFVLAELRRDAMQLYEDVHLLASAYQWSEDAILSLPRSRRMAYSDLVRRDRNSA